MERVAVFNWKIFISFDNEMRMKRLEIGDYSAYVGVENGWTLRPFKTASSSAEIATLPAISSLLAFSVHSLPLGHL